MYRRLRRQLTLWYLLLSGLVCLVLTLVGTWLCYKTVTDSLNKSLEELIASNLPNVEVKAGALRFLLASEPASGRWSRLSSTIQLFDAGGNVIQEYGPKGVNRIFRNEKYFEAVQTGRRVRGTADPIEFHGKTVGYLQVEIPTEIRDRATREFAIVMICILPLLMAVLAVSGYFYSGKAARPVENAFNLLRQFMADAGHELRTPIHAIQLTAENAAAETADKQLIEDMASITRSTDRMGRLVDDMMLLTKLEVKQLEFKNEPVALDKVVQHVVAEVKQGFAQKQISLEVSALPPLTVQGDNDALHRAVINLLQNALRYTDSGGAVTVGLAAEGGRAILTVKDTGIGIPDKSLPFIFDRFYRTDKSRSREAGGSGLGLSIVKAICEQHKGSISVESEEGKGSAFRISLPAVANG